MAPHSSTLAWKIPWAEEPGRLQSMGRSEEHTSELQSPLIILPFFFRLHYFPASGSFSMSQLFASGGQSIGASASVLPMNIQG